MFILYHPMHKVSKLFLFDRISDERTWAFKVLKLLTTLRTFIVRLHFTFSDRHEAYEHELKVMV